MKRLMDYMLEHGQIRSAFELVDGLLHAHPSQALEGVDILLLDTSFFSGMSSTKKSSKPSASKQSKPPAQKAKYVTQASTSSLFNRCI